MIRHRTTARTITSGRFWGRQGRIPFEAALLVPACLLLLTLLFFAPRLQAAPVWGESWLLEQPDGVMVKVRIWGDEFYQVVESPDGYTLVRDPATAVICYARLSADGNELMSTGVRIGDARPESLGLPRHVRVNPAAARAEAVRARAIADERRQEVLAKLGLLNVKLAPPILGNVQGLCLIIDFDDEPATIPASAVDDYCNLPGYTGYGNNGSVRDYFYDVSDGNLTYTNYVPPTWFRAANLKSWYDDCGAPYGSRAELMIKEALNAMEAAGHDFSQYDSNGDGLIDGINCFYAGTTSCGWAQGLWPHSGWMSWSADGVSAQRYQVTGIGSSLRLATFCHENGHMIGYWPDLYDYDHDSAGVGRFCIMCSYTSNTNPQEPCAYLKYISGWTNATVLSTYQTGIVAPSTSNTIFKYEHPYLSNEYYLIENRQRAGRDVGIPDSGLAIWHIDTYGDNSDQQMTPAYHYLVTLVQADGRWDMENNVNTGDASDLWSEPSHTECTPFTDPNTDWWDGSASDLAILDVSAPATDMTFTFNPGGSLHVPAEFPTIQAAIDAALDGAVVSIADGTYTGPGNRDLDFQGKMITVRSTSLDASACIIDCEGGPGDPHRGFIFHSGEGPGSIVEHLTIVNGYKLGAFSAPDTSAGGAILTRGASPTIRDCVLTGNQAADGGAVACLAGSNAQIVGNEISANVASENGGGIALIGAGDATIDGNALTENHAGSTGGGIATSGGGATLIESNVISDNDCTRTDGVLSLGAGAYLADNGNMTLRNNTFAANGGPDGSTRLGGGLYLSATAGAALENCVFFANAAAVNGEACYCEAGASLAVSCTDVFGHAGGDWVGCLAGLEGVDGNFGVDPVFCDAAGGNYEIRDSSPCAPWNHPDGASACNGDLIGAAGVGCLSFAFTDATTGILAGGQISKGAAWGDYDGDGDHDLYIVNDNQPNVLLRNDGPGGFVDATVPPLDDPGAGRGAAWGDFDHDGDLDLYLSGAMYPNRLYRNDGGGVFVDVSGWPVNDASDGRAVCWIDYDVDGLLDLYLVNQDTENKLFRSLGDFGGGWIFVETGDAIIKDSRAGCAATWCDYDSDGDSDCYITNRLAQNALAENVLGFGFNDAAGGTPLADANDGAGAAWGDYNNDGLPDLYVANDGQADLLLKNTGSGFLKITGSPLGDTGHGRGTAWVDFDNDGDLDIYVSRYGEQDRLLKNNGQNVFVDLSLALTGTEGNSNGCSWADYDQDGDLDVYLVCEGANKLLRNDTANGHHWLHLNLTGVESNAAAIGARVRIVCAGQSQIREVTAGSGYLSQNSLTVEFGLGTATVVDSLIITWPSGTVQDGVNIAVDQILNVTEANDVMTDVAGGQDAPALFRLHPCHPNPFNPSVTIRYDLPGPTPVTINVYDVSGRLVRALRNSAPEKAGRHEILWDGRDSSGRRAASGSYFCQITAGSHQAIQRMVMIK